MPSKKQVENWVTYAAILLFMIVGLLVIDAGRRVGCVNEIYRAKLIKEQTDDKSSQQKIETSEETEG